MFSKSLLIVFALLAAVNAAPSPNAPAIARASMCDVSFNYLAVAGMNLSRDVQITPGACTSFADVAVVNDLVESVDASACPCSMYWYNQEQGQVENCNVASETRGADTWGFKCA